jgi:hypothetical protein
MPVILVRRNRNKPEQNQSISDNSLVRGIARGAARAAETGLGYIGDIGRGIAAANEGNPFNIISKTKNIVAEPTSRIIREKVTKKLTGQYLEPQNTIERIADEVASDIPLQLISGGLSGLGTAAKTVGRSIAANTVGQNLKETGADPFTQFAGSYLAGKGFASLTGGGLTKKIKNLAQARKVEDYKKADEAGRKINIYVPKLNPARNALKTELDIIKKAVEDKKPSLPWRKPLIEDIEDLQYKVAKRTSKVLDMKKELTEFNEQFRKADEPKKVFLRWINKTLGRSEEGFLGKVGAQYPEFGQPYNTAQDIHIAENFNKDFRKMIHKNPELSDIITSGALKTALKVGAKAGAKALNKSAQSRLNFWRGAYNNNANYWFNELGKAALLEEKVPFANALRQLNAIASQSEQQKNEEPKGKVILVRKSKNLA